MSFEVTTYGKWILAGEHSVLRGVPALVFPVKNCSLNFKHTESDKDIQAEFSGEFGKELEVLFWGVLEKALNQVGRQRQDLKGLISMDSNLPLGSGLGASAALCVAIGSFFKSLGWIEKPEVYEFSRQLENLFHGESSGVDIAVNLSGVGIRFLRGGEWAPVKMNWNPQWYISYCGQRGITSECVKKVKGLEQSNPELFKSLDEQMRKASEMAESALSLDERQGFSLLTESIQQARDCFEKWDLCRDELGKHMDHLMAQGASAVKPTGSGGGGFVLSLWRSTPPENLKDQLILV